MFRYTKSMEGHCIWCRGISYCCFAREFFVDTSYFLKLIDIEAENMLFEIFISFRTTFNKCLII